MQLAQTYCSPDYQAKRLALARIYAELGESMMFNMSGAGLLTVAAAGGEGGPTPRTPEILNSLISMTNPFDRLRPAATASAASPGSDSSCSPPSVQHTCSQLIKEGLKHTLQNKRRNNSVGSSSGGSPLPGLTPGRANSPDSLNNDNSNEGLTPEDEERRRRRRERNKIAATKCRQKKRERTNNLVYESEALETQNLDLKSKIQELENQRRKLVEVLTIHRSSCTKQPFTSTSSPSSYHSEYRSEYSAGSSSYPSTSYEVVCTTESSTYHHHHHRSSTVIEEIGYTPVISSPYIYRDRIPRDPIITYTQSEMHLSSDDMLRQNQGESPAYPLLNGAGGYPLCMAASTSSSDYESNTELLDSPTGPYPLTDDPSTSFSSSSSVFPSTTCIS